ncbi:hypothetical protein JZ751_019923, partial [Albula glossodonta]
MVKNASLEGYGWSRHGYLGKQNSSESSVTGGCCGDVMEPRTEVQVRSQTTSKCPQNPTTVSALRDPYPELGVAHEFHNIAGICRALSFNLILKSTQVRQPQTQLSFRETKLNSVSVSVCSKMAQAGDLLDQDQFSCPICLDLLKDPVTIPCGHSYCMGCIKDCWDQDDHTGVYSCPQCRQTFTPRPVLGRNIIVAQMVEKLKKTGLQAAPPAHCYAGPGDVACDVCTGRKLKAVKSCLVCQVSYCETHLQPHYESPAFKKHKLVQATGNLQEKICSHHDKPLEVYCRTDQQCICLLCLLDEHKGHDTVSAAAERTEKQKELGETKRKSQQRIQEREKELQDLRQAVQSLTRSAQAAVEDSERIFIELIRSIERGRSEVKELIRDQEKAAVSRAERLLERLEQEIAELRRRDTELEQLSHTEDHIHFLQLKERLEDVCDGELVKISQTVKEVHIVEPRTREDFLQYVRCQGGSFSKEGWTGSSPSANKSERMRRDLLQEEGNVEESIARGAQRTVGMGDTPSSERLHPARRPGVINGGLDIAPASTT